MDGVAAANQSAQAKHKDKVAIMGVGDPVDADGIEKKIAEKESEGYTFDTIIISGHDGSGHFFGENGNVLASEVSDIVERRSQAVEVQNQKTGAHKVPLNQSLT